MGNYEIDNWFFFIKKWNNVDYIMGSIESNLHMEIHWEICFIANKTFNIENLKHKLWKIFIHVFDHFVFKCTSAWCEKPGTGCINYIDIIIT